MDTSIKAANAGILAMLTKCEPLGMTVEELMESLGFGNKNQLLPRLRDLQGRGKVEPVPSGMWRKVQEGDKVVIDIGDTSAFFPPSPKFVSYKNSLQIYCQRKRMAVPVYSVAKKPSGYFGVVRFGERTVGAKTGMPLAKDAEQRVAFDALMELGLCELSEPFLLQKGLKRTAPSLEDDPPTKIGKLVSVAPYKSMLHELAQKKRLPAPIYETWDEGQGFLASVTFNGRDFKAAQPCPSKKEAEQLAAHVALYQGGQVSEPPRSTTLAQEQESNQPDQPMDDIPVAMETEVPLSSAKNLLQEYCQKRNLDLPSYETDISTEGGFISTVRVAHATYRGGDQRTKKAAEKSAAAVAVRSLGIATQCCENIKVT